ncbi:MAG: OmpA family protein [Bacteroidales bacterium]
MKRIHNFLVLLALAAIVSSCAPIYKCGDPVPLKQRGGKRMKALITERDELCTDLSQKVKENESLKLDIQTLNQEKNNLNRNLNDLNKDYSDLQLRYKNLSDESLSQADQFSRTLQMKSEELENKEKLLLERERTLRELQQVIARQDSITKRLNSVLRNALLGFNADDLSVEIKNGKVYVSMSDRLLFKSGSALVEAKGKEAIQLLADVLNNNPDIEILVEGHTDNIPIKTAVFKDNWDLSVVRATSIVRILTEDYKITPTRVTASGKGEFFPKASNDTPEGRALNRRTEIILSPKLDEIMQLLNVNQN